MTRPTSAYTTGVVIGIVIWAAAVLWAMGEEK